MRDFGTWLLDRGVILAAALVATAASLIASYSGLCGTAGLAGWSTHTQPMLPLTVDVIAIACGVLVQRTRNAELRAVAWRGVIVSAGVSVGGNAVDHLWTITHSGGSPIRVALAIIVSMIPAVGIAFVVHVLALMTGTEDTAQPQPVPEDQQPIPAPELEAEAEAELVLFPTQQQTPHSIRQGTMKARALALFAETGRILTVDELVEEFGCTVRYAQMIRESATA